MGTYLGKIPVGVALPGGEGLLKFFSVKQTIAGDVCELEICEDLTEGEFVVGQSLSGDFATWYIIDR